MIVLSCGVLGGGGRYAGRKVACCVFKIIRSFGSLDGRGEKSCDLVRLSECLIANVSINNVDASKSRWPVSALLLHIFLFASGGENKVGL